MRRSIKISICILLLIASPFVMGIGVLLFLETSDVRPAHKLKRSLQSVETIDTYSLIRHFEDNSEAQIWYSDGSYLRTPTVNSIYAQEGFLFASQINGISFDCTKGIPNLRFLMLSILQEDALSENEVLSRVPELGSLLIGKTTISFVGNNGNGAEYENTCTLYRKPIPQKPDANIEQIYGRG